MQQEPAVIELQVDKVGQLFDTFDPMPFRERDLDRKAENYIVGWARERRGNKANPASEPGRNCAPVRWAAVCGRSN